ncbi:MAG: EF-P beta-lysylation protein EpmB [Gammaproteobacteria bacterium]
MIPRTLPAGQPAAWQIELAQAINDSAQLLQMLGLGGVQSLAAAHSTRDFALRVPRGYVARMRMGDPHDPLLRQVLPIAEEQAVAPGFSSDAVGDIKAMTIPGLLHKYHGRVLLVTTGACAVHCRYCFRRHFPYADANPATGQWEAALDYIRADPSIHEVILSGGDPLSLTDQRLALLSSRLVDIPHLRTLRIHTRLPIVLPARVDDALLSWLTGNRLKPVVVVHANHANEIDDAVRAALGRFTAAHVPLFNQSVLLHGVNNSAAALADLSHALFNAGVTPYYLHMLDRVQGAAHFEVDEAAACQLLDELLRILPGYLVPRLVREREGAPNKLSVLTAPKNDEGA